MRVTLGLLVFFGSLLHQIGRFQLQMPQNVLANGSEITVDIPIRVPQDSNSQCFKLFITMCVRHFMLGKFVLSSVDLYCKHVAVDVEVNDIVSNVLLNKVQAVLVETKNPNCIPFERLLFTLKKLTLLALKRQKKYWLIGW
jgi:hypothetical protein